MIGFVGRTAPSAPVVVVGIVPTGLANPENDQG